MALLPFAKEAKRWEPIALELRKLVGLAKGRLLDPWELAPKVGLRVFDQIAGLQGLSKEEKDHLLLGEPDAWSAGVYPEPFDDGSYLCILNPTHSKKRQKISLMEEISHRYLEHEPSTITIKSDGICIRDFSKDNERDAYGVGAAALLPWYLFFPMVSKGMTQSNLSKRFEVSTALIEYRLKVTGGMRTYKARQR